MARRLERIPREESCLGVHLYLDMSGAEIKALPEPSLELPAATVVHVIADWPRCARRCRIADVALVPGDTVILHTDGHEQLAARIEGTGDHDVIIALG